jgi:hypothetical protein
MSIRFDEDDPNHFVVLVRGYVGSGKTTFCSTFARLEEKAFLDTTVLPGVTKQRAGSPPYSYNGSPKGHFNLYSKLVGKNTVRSVFDHVCDNGNGQVDDKASSDSEKIKITLIDTSGFDLDVAGILPPSMLRRVRGVILLISVSPEDMRCNDTVGWCCTACEKFLSSAGVAGIPMVVAGNKFDLALSEENFGLFEKLLKMGKLNEDSGDIFDGVNPGENEPTDAAEERMFAYWNHSLDVVKKGFVKRCSSLLTLTGTKLSDKFISFPLVCSLSGHGINRTIYALVAKGMFDEDCVCSKNHEKNGDARGGEVPSREALELKPLLARKGGRKSKRHEKEEDLIEEKEHDDPDHYYNEDGEYEYNDGGCCFYFRKSYRHVRLLIRFPFLFFKETSTCTPFRLKLLRRVCP